MKKFKKLKLVVLLILFIVLIIPIFYLVLPDKSNNEHSLIRMFLLFILFPILGWVILELTDIVLEVPFLFSGFIFSLSALFGGYLIFVKDGFMLDPLSLVGGINIFFMSLLLMRTFLLWQSRRAVKKN